MAWARPSWRGLALKYVPERIISPSGMKATSTGLSMPLLMTGSRPVPSGRQRKMCEAFVFHSWPFTMCVCSLHLPLFVRTGRFGDVKPAFLVERGNDWPLNERRSGRKLDGEAVRHFRQRARDRRVFSSENRFGGRKRDCDKNSEPNHHAAD